MHNRVNILLLAVMLLAGCNNVANKESPAEIVNARTIHRSMLCNGLQAAPLLRWITAEGVYFEMYPLVVSDHSDGRHASPPGVNFSEDAVLLISMGQRRTAGYNLELSRDPPLLRDGELTVPIVWTVPAEGLFVAQVITHPCFILTLPRRDIRSVTVMDQSGSVLLSGEIKEIEKTIGAW
ncbi:MAG: protease complex subunit PrcB family protein [Halobacteria archaeon]|nr:protease complex subunit PrcB family protein [Halobacteria archaeon]